MTLGGYICVRNGDEGDYCWREAAESLLPVVDELILCDSDSTDGTREAMDRWADAEPKIRVINYPWPEPKGDGKWWVKFLNFAREHLKTDFQITVDADEILSDHPDCHAAIREAMLDGKPRTFNRLNFWKDASHLIPEGHAVGKWVTRFGPASCWMPSDEGHSAGELYILDNATRDRRLEIFHMGFLRKKDAFWKKAKVVLGAFFNNYDERLTALETTGKGLAEIQNCEWTNKLDTWDGYMPNAAQRWLAERGHDTQLYLGMNERELYQRVQVTHGPVKSGEPMDILIVGDYGDVIQGMSIFKEIGKVRLFYRDANHLCKRIVHRMPVLEPLLRSQPYIVDVVEHVDQVVHWNAGDFRTQHSYTHSLAKAHLLHYRGQKQLPPITPHFNAPWITGIKADARGFGKVIVNRTNRYQNPAFRWRDVVTHYGEAILFVGSPDEHAAFCRDFGNVTYMPTSNLLEAAQLIAGASLFIGNQSACFSIAEAMKRPRCLEVCTWQPDVIVAPDAKLYLSADGALELPPLAGKPELVLRGTTGRANYNIQTSFQPRSGWKYRGDSRPTFSQLHRFVIKRHAMTELEAKKAILDELAEREPTYFGATRNESLLEKFHAAVANAG